MENSQLINKAVEYAKRYATDSEISVRTVAENSGFSIDYFNRIFLAHTGFTVAAYINFIRLKKAALALRTTDKSVLDIALESGYDSHEGFTKAFKKMYGSAPTEYRAGKKNQIPCLGEFTDRTVASRFIYENPDLSLVDPDEVIDFLLEKDPLRYGYFCTTIKYCGLRIAAPHGDFRKGFIAVGDNLNGKYFLEIVTDDLSSLAVWLKRFEQAKTFYSNLSEADIKAALIAAGINVKLKVTEQSVFSGKLTEYTLPEGIEIRKLTANDKNSIIKWADGKIDSYVRHLLNEQDYSDKNNLEYGIFQANNLIAVAGCGIDEVHGLRLNNCCNIRFAKGKESDSLYRAIFTRVTNDITESGVLAFDDLQYGEYAATHGCFTSTDLGYKTVNRRFDII